MSKREICFYSCSRQHGLKIALHSSNRSDTKCIDLHGCNILNKELGKCWFGTDTFHLKKEQRRQYGNSFLLVPSNIERDR